VTKQQVDELQSLVFLIIIHANVQSARRLAIYAFRADSITSDKS